MALRFAAFDRQWKQTADAAIAPRVCECCPTAGAVTAEGPIVAFRHRSEDEIRDIYVSRLVDGRWSEPRAVHHDGWQISACPVNGPALSARGRDVAIAWFTMQQGEGRAFAAFSNDAGRTFGSPVRLDDAGTLGRVDIELLPDGSAAASWVEYARPLTEFRVRRIDRSGGRSAAVTVAPMISDRASGYPRMALQGNELVFAWVQRTRSSGASAPGSGRVMTATALVKSVAPR
jgi:hypothetical protein